MNGENKFGLSITVALVAGCIALFMNTCALDRLESQIIRNTKTLEGIKSGGGGSSIIRGPEIAGAVRGEPGSPTGATASGWNGANADILHVAGAVSNAPLTLAQKPKPQGGVYTNRRSSPPKSLNYYTTSEGETTTITRYILDRLLLIDPYAPPKVVPGLATSWEVSEDKLTYTYHLRKGAQFADGRAFTSADVKFSFDAMRDPGVQADHLRGSFEDVVSLETPDDYTVVVKYRKKYWKGIYTFGNSLRILNKGWYEDYIPKKAKQLDIEEFSVKPGTPGFGEVFNKIRIVCPGAGPYYYAQDTYEPAKQVQLQQNPFWYGIQVYPQWYNLKELRWVFITDPVAAFESFRKGEFDVSVVDFYNWDDEFSKDPSITGISNYYEYDHMGLGFSYIMWNNRKAPFDDARVRRAMTHLTNRQWLLDEVERGRGSIAVSPHKRIYPGYDNTMKPLAFDIEKAKALLAEAGWTDSDGDGILDKDGRPFEFEFKIGSPRRFYAQVAAALGDACKQVGIRMNLRQLEWSTFIQDLYERRFDSICLLSSFADPWIDPYDDFHSSTDVPYGGNTPGWRNKEADRLLEAMREEFDEEKRTKLFHEFHRLFQQEQPMTLLIHSMVGVLQSNRFEDVKVLPTGLRMQDYWIKQDKLDEKR